MDEKINCHSLIIRLYNTRICISKLINSTITILLLLGPIFPLNLHNLNYVDALLPRSPVQCYATSNCTVFNYLGVWPDRSTCKAAAVKFPATEPDLVAAVAEAVKNKQKIKVVSRYAHSIPKLTCPDGSDGMVISTRDYDQTIHVDVATSTVLVDSGVELRQLLDGIAAAGLALPYAPYWDGVSIGGLLSTGATGSSFFQKGGAVHEYVTYMSLVVPASADEGYAKIVELTEDGTPEEFLAAKVSLGVLGVISKVKLKLEPIFKRSVTYESMSDGDLEDRIMTFAQEHEFGDVMWHPAMSTADYRIDDRVGTDVHGDGVYDFVGFRPTPVSEAVAARLLEDTYEATEAIRARCVQSRAEVDLLQSIRYGLQNDVDGFDGRRSFTSYPVIGYNHKIQSTGTCLRNDKPDVICPWDPRFKSSFYHMTTFSIPTSTLSAFISDVKALRNAVSQNAAGLCGIDLYNGLLMRFVKKSTAFLGEIEDSVSMDVTYYRASDSGDPRLLEDVLEELEQIAVFKYGAKPHWGKNRPVAFQNVWTKFGTKLERFLNVKNKLDPEGLFSSAWTDALLGLAGPQPAQLYADSDGCALEGLCICSVDSHCAPGRGYFCRPGRIFADARVCRKLIK